MEKFRQTNSNLRRNNKPNYLVSTAQQVLYTLVMWLKGHDLYELTRIRQRNMWYDVNNITYQKNQINIQYYHSIIRSLVMLQYYLETVTEPYKGMDIPPRYSKKQDFPWTEAIFMEKISTTNVTNVRLTWMQ